MLSFSKQESDRPKNEMKAGLSRRLVEDVEAYFHFKPICSLKCIEVNRYRRFHVEVREIIDLAPYDVGIFIIRAALFQPERRGVGHSPVIFPDRMSASIQRVSACSMTELPLNASGW